MFLYCKLKVEPALLSEYHNIQEQERKGIIEIADEALGDVSNNKGVHYSLHHAVVRKDRETTKVRHQRMSFHSMTVWKLL